MRNVMIAAVATVAATGVVLAAPLTRGRALAIMHERHDGMEKIGDANKLLRRELSGGSPNLAAVRSATATIADLSSRASRWFPAGTGRELGKTRAKPDIWRNPHDFAAKLRDFQTAARALNAAAIAGDAGAISARYSELGGTCKACHDTYRADEKR